MSTKKNKRNYGPRIDKSLKQLLQELDDELFLLRRDLHFLREDHAVIRTIATRLRNLVCVSDENDGLLWKLAKRLGVSDEIELKAFESVNRGAALNTGLEFWKIPFNRADQGSPFAPAGLYSLRQIINETEPIYVPSIHVERITHQWLIKAAAEQIGGAHVDDGISPALLRIAEISINGIRPLVEVFAFDAELALQIGERVLDQAAIAGEHNRVPRFPPQGDVSVVVKLTKRESLGGRFRLVTLRSYISEVEIDCVAMPLSIGFVTRKRGTTIGEFTAPHPPDWQCGVRALYTFEYSSNRSQALTLTNLNPNSGSPLSCDIGWLEERELVVLPEADQHFDATRQFFHDAQCGAFPAILRPDELSAFLNDQIQNDLFKSF